MKTYDEIIENIQVIYPRLYYLCKEEIFEWHSVYDIYRQGTSLPVDFYGADCSLISDCMDNLRKHFKFKEDNRKLFEDIQNEITYEISGIWIRDQEKIKSKEVKDVRIRRLT